jgi:putative membrane protein
MDRWDNDHMNDGWGVVMVLGMLGVWALVAVAIWWMARTTQVMSQHSAGISPGRSNPMDAKQILADRLARGEIDPEEYRARMEALSSSP